MATPLKLGTHSNAVGDWQRTLLQLGRNAGAIDRDFGPATLAATSAFQSARGIPVTGVVDEATLDQAQSLLALAANSIPGFPGLLVRSALSQLGTSEDPVGSNQGPALQKYWAATNYGDGCADKAPWCSAFAVWVFQQAIKQAGNPAAFTEENRPKSASAWSWLDTWAPAHPSLVQIISPDKGVPRPGDIVVYTFHHVALVESYNSRSVPSIFTIEGNSNDDGSAEGYEVVRHARRPDQCRGFIRVRAA